MSPLPSNYSASILERHQRDIAARLEAHAFFADAQIFLVRPRDQESFVTIDERIAQANKGVLKRNGKTGLSLQVLMPVADTEKPGAANPTLRLTYTVRVQELPVVNMGPSGTRISAEEAALEALSLLHNFMPGPANAFFPDQAVLTPSDQFDPFITYDLRMSQIWAAARAVRCAFPIISVDAGLVTLTCATSGAALRYTVDGSYPSAANSAASLYSVPFTAPAEGILLRVAADKSGHQQSDIAQRQF